MDLPEVAELPSEGVEYGLLPEDTVKELVDTLTATVFHWVRQ